MSILNQALSLDRLDFNDLPYSAWAGAALAAVLIVLAFIYHDRLAFVNKRPENAVEPNMGRWPLIGHTLFIAQRKDTVLDGLLEFQQHPGNHPERDGDRSGWAKTSSFLPLGRMVMINRPEWIEYVQKTNFSNFPKGQTFRDLFADLLGMNGIFVADGDIWRTQRKLAAHVFSVGNFKTHVQQVLQEELDVLHQLFSHIASSGQSVDLQDIFFRFTLASFGRLAFNQDFSTLPSHPSELSKDVPFASAFDYAQKRVDMRLTTPFWPLVEFLTPSGIHMRKAKKVVNEYARNVIDIRLEERKAGKSMAGEKGRGGDASKGGRDLLDLFVDQGLDRDALVETVLNLIIAGRDTTAQALSWQFWELSQHPEVAQKCREESERVLQGRKAEYEDLPELVYLTATFYETLRLHPSVPKNMKEVTEDDELPGIPSQGVPPVKVQKGDKVVFSDWVMGRMPEIWGEDCCEFKPERWIDESGTLKKVSQYKFHAFNAGPRLCLGQTLATFEGVGLTAYVLTNFRIDVLPGQSTPQYGNSLTHPIRNPYEVRIATI